MSFRFPTLTLVAARSLSRQSLLRVEDTSKILNSHSKLAFSHHPIAPHFSWRALHRTSRDRVENGLGGMSRGRAGKTKHHAPSFRAASASSSNTTSSSSSSSAIESASAAAAETAVPPAAEIVPRPTARQLIMHALTAAVPMIGFGFMDNTIMIHAGHYVDCTLGVTFGLSTLAAAGIGQIFSGIGGVVFGDALEELFHRISPGTPTKMTKAQRNLRIARSAGLLGGIVGVTLGCTLGLVNLYFVDEYEASLLKLHALEEGQEFEFEVEVDNEVNPGYTTVIVRGPDVDGVLASITACIASYGCSVAELHAGYRKEGDIAGVSTNEDGTAAEGETGTPHGAGSASAAVESLTSLLHPPPPRVEDIFLVRNRSTQQALENEELESLGRQILAAAKDPLNSHSLKSRLEELQFENDALAERVLLLERMLESRQIKVVRSAAKVDDD